MKLTGLKGNSYENTSRSKRTTPRNHQADLAAREHYKTRASRRPKQTWVTDNNGLTFTPVHSEAA